MQLTLREINKENWEECIRLQVADHQAAYIPSNLYTLAESKVYPDRVPLAIYDDEKIVGMLVCSFDAEAGRAWIHRLMVDATQQSKGYTRATVKKMIRRLKQIEGCRVISVEYRKGEAAWEKFYDAFGFKKNGQQSEKGDVVASMYVEPEIEKPADAEQIDQPGQPG